MLNQVLHAQTTEQLNADRYERTDERQGYRNGPYHHQTVGKLTLRVPRIRDGKFSTELFARYQRNEQALVLSLMEMVINGVSTRKVSQITEELCGTEFSKSTVSELCKNLDPLVTAWNTRPLTREYPFVLVDALYMKVRENGRIHSRGVMIATGIHLEGRREVLGLHVGDTESEQSWGAFFQQLKQRGLRGVEMITSDHHGGLVRAVRQHMQGITWQRCQTHFMRNILDAAPKGNRNEIRAHVRSIFDAADPKAARALLEQTVEKFKDLAPKAMDTLEDGFDEATAVHMLPMEYRVRTRTTNAVERLNEEIRRRERVIRIFPNRKSLVRLIGALLMDLDEKWETERIYLNMKGLLEWRKTRTTPEAKVIRIS